MHISRKCLQKFVCLLNINRNSIIGTIAPTGWETNDKEYKEVNVDLFKRSFQALSTKVTTQELINFKSNKLSIPDLTELEIQHILSTNAKQKS